MRAAVITSFDAPPAYGEHPDPVATGEHDMVVEVLAAGLHHLTRAKANGTHYSATGDFPLVPGVDGVVRDGAGRLRYAVLDDTNLGTFAERTVIDARRSVLLSDDIDPVRVAAAMNPAMASWVALRRRIAFREGQSVLVLGATGSAGGMAVQIAKRFGAAQVVAAGRDTTRFKAIEALGADRTITFDEAGVAADVDVVLDFLWGEPAAGAMLPMLTARADRSAPLTWIQIGSMAGATAPVPSAALRAARLQILGSGIGSVTPRDFIAELPELADAVTEGALDVHARAVPMAEIAQAWTERTRERLVFVP
ncbi:MULTISPECIES: zinc-binding alcohol dehydrogenase family protein [unclassified Streptomyces]|uniref:quinone oxidoreductase family protein n=1 Tax=unclassified Streptomyces TaxID=2593676 RepID=UPI0001C18B15|nr:MULTISPECIES: zinc-binding alcohol dehydrogenase family protein [unclassified Streptomyces]AEN08089.1 Alcohol dehydrogenase zinc-binding domain protein [Streptomyces sp. SirexAA-E]MYR68406.1 zinc-binding alcohol dehydrogenase family protein [Streptomyces sp. SID4939]MYS02110.1 zinc-binding alcohol dehydrogenase family protein [Streptomyces sp. SID4940]MYT66761.1 zinc-binding alcohol dehydrogenase family protein [Streptomyces sp. SID8357]MYT83682.1 zinc-binding alcohol dehydrogenase family p